MDIALALGGGGIRGIAHIGVIRCLERAGLTIKAIAGTSAGGLIGAVYAAGYPPDKIEKILGQVNQKKMFGRKPGDGPSMMGLAGLTNLLVETIGPRTFADLHIPFAVTAVDMDSGEEVILNHGPVVQAVLATVAVPGVFPPIRIGDVNLIDGGGLDPVPVSIARWLAPGCPIIAVALSQPSAPVKHFGLPLLIPGPAPLVETFSRLRPAQALSIFIQSTEISSNMLTELRLQVDHPDIIIRPAVAQFSLIEQVSVPELVKLGDAACTSMLPELNKIFSWTSQISRTLRNRMSPGPAINAKVVP